ncbi:hypothetical protein ALTER154_80100 [Alteromonas sp. 154]|nr:hypothetical protein ALTER154_80100 [Alteromonas sp. 154]
MTNWWQCTFEFKNINKITKFISMLPTGQFSSLFFHLVHIRYLCQCR